MRAAKAAGTVKWILIAVLAFALIWQAMRGRSSGTPFSEMAEAVSGAADLSSLAEADNQMFRRLYGLDMTDYDGVLLYYPADSMGAEELLVLKMKDKSQADEVRSAIEGRLATQIRNFDGYGAEQTAMLKDSAAVVRGNYALFVSARNKEPVVAAFEQNY